MKRKTKPNDDYLNELAAMLPKERVARAKKEADREIFKIQLSELRKKFNIKIDLLYIYIIS